MLFNILVYPSKKLLLMSLKQNVLLSIISKILVDTRLIKNELLWTHIANSMEYMDQTEKNSLLSFIAIEVHIIDILTSIGMTGSFWSSQVQCFGL